MNYEDQKKHESKFLSLTSLTVVEFEYLLGYFEPLWEKHYRYHTLQGGPGKHPAFREHGNSLLKGTAQKLFFLLVYLKNNPLQTFQAASFGISQPKVSAITRCLLSVLDEALGRLGLLPSRDSCELARLLAGHRSRVFWLDGVEAGVQRNADQKQEFSGKKRGHRLNEPHALRRLADDPLTHRVGPHARPGLGRALPHRVARWLDAQAGPGISGPRASGGLHRAAFQEAQGRSAHPRPEDI